MLAGIYIAVSLKLLSPNFSLPSYHPQAKLTSHYPVVIKGTVQVLYTTIISCLLSLSHFIPRSQQGWHSFTSIHPPPVNLPLLVCCIQLDEAWATEAQTTFVSMITVWMMCGHMSSFTGNYPWKAWNRNEQSEAVNKLLRHAQRLYQLAEVAVFCHNAEMQQGIMGHVHRRHWRPPFHLIYTQTWLYLIKSSFIDTPGFFFISRILLILVHVYCMDLTCKLNG